MGLERAGDFNGPAPVGVVFDNGDYSGRSGSGAFYLIKVMDEVIQ
jgi:hypothetical protein